MGYEGRGAPLPCGSARAPKVLLDERGFEDVAALAHKAAKKCYNKGRGKGVAEQNTQNESSK